MFLFAIHLSNCSYLQFICYILRIFENIRTSLRSHEGYEAAGIRCVVSYPMHQILENQVVQDGLGLRLGLGIGLGPYPLRCRALFL